MFQLIIGEGESVLHIRIKEEKHQSEPHADRCVSDIENIGEKLEIRSTNERHPLRPIEVEEWEIEHIHYPTFEPVGIPAGIGANRSDLRGEWGIEDDAIENAIEDIAGSTGSDHSESDDEPGSEFGVSDSLTEAPYQAGDGDDTAERKEEFIPEFEAESHAIIFDKTEVEPRADLIILAEVEMSFDPDLDDLVSHEEEYDDSGGDPPEIMAQRRGTNSFGVTRIDR